jgi:hypothetical protein
VKTDIPLRKIVGRIKNVVTEQALIMLLKCALDGIFTKISYREFNITHCWKNSSLVAFIVLNLDLHKVKLQ